MATIRRISTHKQRLQQLVRAVHPAVAIISLAVVVLAGVLWWFRPQGPPQDWDLAACDIGQGDMLVLNTGEGHAVVVDTGPEPELADQCLRRLGIHTIEHLFITHQHADHYKGIPGVKKNRRIQAISYNTAGKKLLLDPAGTTPQRATVGQRYHWPQRGRGGALEVVVLGAEQKRIVSENDSSIVLAVAHHPSGRTVLLTGDLEEEQFAYMRRQKMLPQRIDLLKVGHHGARNSGVEAAAFYSPPMALISVGRNNDYGHPHPQILSAYQQVNSRIVRTDELGSIWIRFTGTGMDYGSFSTPR